MSQMLRKSCVSMLANLLKFKNAIQVFQKFGFNVSIKSNIKKIIVELSSYPNTLTIIKKLKIKNCNTIVKKVVWLISYSHENFQIFY